MYRSGNHVYEHRAICILYKLSSLMSFKLRICALSLQQRGGENRYAIPYEDRSMQLKAELSQLYDARRVKRANHYTFLLYFGGVR
jgi:hypothetical protein